MIRILNALLGLAFTIVGLLVLCYVGWEWHFISVSKILWLSFVGVTLTIIGSVAIVIAFKGESSIRDTVLAKHCSMKMIILYVFLLVQCLILVFQIHELLRYSDEIEPYMTSMTREGSDTVEPYFYLGTIFIPFICQILLLPIIWSMVIYTSANSWRGAFISLGSSWLLSFSWFASFVGFAYTIMTFD